MSGIAGGVTSQVGYYLASSGPTVDLTNDANFSVLTIDPTIGSFSGDGFGSNPSSQFRQNNAGVDSSGTAVDFEVQLVDVGSTVASSSSWTGSATIDAAFGTSATFDLTGHSGYGSSLAGSWAWTTLRYRFFEADGTYTTQRPVNVRILVADLDGADYNADGSALNDGTDSDVQHHEFVLFSNTGLQGIALNAGTTLNQVETATLPAALSSSNTDPYTTTYIGDMANAFQTHGAIQVSYVAVSEVFITHGLMPTSSTPAPEQWEADFENTTFAGLDVVGSGAKVAVYQLDSGDWFEVTTGHRYDGDPAAIITVDPAL